MSYARWSSDNYQCDVYVWHDIAGTWRTEVAARRPIFDVDLPPPVDQPIGEAHSPERRAWANAWTTRERQVRDLLGDSDDWTFRELDEPDGGRSYEHATPGECADNLERLRDAGFNVPQSAINSLRDESEEG